MAKKHWTLAAAFVLATAVAPTAVLAASDDTTSGSRESVSSYEEAVKLVETGRYEHAIEALDALNAADPGNADVLNMLGYAHRKIGSYESAQRHYDQALAIEPAHLGANEYLGELYLKTNRLREAESRLDVLASACPSGCEEHDELAEAIAAYRQGNKL